MEPYVETIFTGNGVTGTFVGSGQAAAKNALKAGHHVKVILIGFNVDGLFIPADLSISSKNPLSA